MSAKGLAMSTIDNFDIQTTFWHTPEEVIAAETQQRALLREKYAADVSFFLNSKTVTQGEGGSTMRSLWQKIWLLLGFKQEEKKMFTPEEEERIEDAIRECDRRRSYYG